MQSCTVHLLWRDQIVTTGITNEKSRESRGLRSCRICEDARAASHSGMYQCTCVRTTDSERGVVPYSDTYLVFGQTYGSYLEILRLDSILNSHHYFYSIMLNYDFDWLMIDDSRFIHSSMIDSFAQRQTGLSLKIYPRLTTHVSNILCPSQSHHIIIRI